MARRGLLNDADRNRLFGVPDDDASLIRFYSVSDDDRELFCRSVAPAINSAWLCSSACSDIRVSGCVLKTRCLRL